MKEQVEKLAWYHAAARKPLRRALRSVRKRVQECAQGRVPASVSVARAKSAAPVALEVEEVESDDATCKVSERAAGPNRRGVQTSGD